MTLHTAPTPQDPQDPGLATARPPLQRGAHLWWAAAALLMSACTTALPPPAASVPNPPPVQWSSTPGGIPVDVSYTATGQDSRVLFLILHYTVADLPQSLHILTRRQVSSHYLLSDEEKPRVYRLVDEGRRAWHSGPSVWKGHRMLNASSIGIEIVHPGYRLGPDKERIYQPFGQAQMDMLVPLIRDIVARHRIRPERILGHGEVTAQYKEDPGPTFPWRLLSELGITPPWPEESRVRARRTLFEASPPDVQWYQRSLAQHGYLVEPSGQWDEQTRRVLMNFQMRYRPSSYAGTPDAETAALLYVLTTPLQTP